MTDNQPASNAVAANDARVLAPYEPRRFVPVGADLANAEQVKSLHEQLLERVVGSVGELEQWLGDLSELEAALNQTRAVLYIRMTCQTDDPQRAEAYKQFVTTVQPAVKPFEHTLNEKYLSLREQFALPADVYDVYDRGIRADVELYRPQNVGLQTQESLLKQEYQAVCGAMTVQFDGKEHTVQQMAKFLQEPDRDLRERAWQATADRQLQDRDRLDELFDKLLALRSRIAQNADCPSYVEYKFKEYHRFEYAPRECERYHAGIEQAVVPLLERLYREQARTMKLERLRPWDTIADSKGRAPLKPFETIQEFVAGTERIFQGTDPELGKQFGMMISQGLLDLDSRKGKAPGGYQSTLTEARKPFIFMNAVGLNRDVRTLLHEGGHAFHAFAAASQALYPYRHAPMEFCEVASMGMELLAGEYLDEFYSPDDNQRSRREHLEGIVTILAWVATIDAFQHWLYRNPGHTSDQRVNAWFQIRHRFGGTLIDWSGLEDRHESLWQRQLHLYQYPFYYIEYGIAQIGALQLWQRSKEDPAEALAGYRRALALGGSRPLPKLFEAAGLRFDFGPEMIAELMEMVSKELDQLPV